MGSAISAARMGCKVALIQDRPVLGGNGSSEIRVWSQGGTTLGKYPKLGEIVEEFADSAKASPGTAEEFGDEKKEAIVRAEKNISLFLNTQAFAVEMKDGKIAAVIARDMGTGRRDALHRQALRRLHGPRHDRRAGRRPISTWLEKGHMGMSNMWRWADTDKPQTFPETPWALPLTMADFPYPKHGKAEWFWEGGFFRDPINDLEYIRDWNLRAAYGAFNAMKNGDGKDKHANAKLEWVAYVGGNRESRLLTGDVVLTREDIISKKDFPDGCVPTTWSIDLHVPKEQYAKKFPEDPFISKAIFDSRVDKKNGYPVPYRCFYSRQHPQPVHGRPRHQRGPRGAGHGARDADVRHDGRSGRQGGVDLREGELHAARGLREPPGRAEGVDEPPRPGAAGDGQGPDRAGRAAARAARTSPAAAAPRRRRPGDRQWDRPEETGRAS